MRVHAMGAIKSDDQDDCVGLHEVIQDGQPGLWGDPLGSHDALATRLVTLKGP
jgi:hypothetical protein